MCWLLKSFEKMEHVYLIAYDIADDRRLHRIAKLMEGYGVRVQKSIFESALSETELKELKWRTLQLLDPVEDGVKFFKLCERCQQKTGVIGKGRHTDLLKRLLIV